MVGLCGALVAIDLLFVAVHAGHAIGISLYNDDVPVLGWRWDIGEDLSYPEFFGYLKMAVIVALLLSIPRGRKRPVYLALGAIFAFALLDDALQLHERIGYRLAHALALPALGGLRPVDLGELIVWAAVGVTLLAAAIAALVRSPPDDRSNGLLLLAAFGVLLAFAVGADMAHIILMDSFRYADLLFTVIEDGGEQITLSLTWGLAILIRREVRRRDSGG